MFRKKTDERLEKESNVLYAKMYYLTTILLLVSLAVKLACRLPFPVFALEVLCLLAGGAYFLVQEIRKGILGLRGKDEALLEIHRGILAKAYLIDFELLLIGELIFLYALKEYFVWVLSYFAAWVPSSLIITVASVKKGWLVRTGQAQGEKGKRSFLLSVIIASIAYGTFMSLSEIYHGGAFHAKGFLCALGMAAGWGIPFYLVMNFFIKRSEKRADKRLEEVNQDEE